ncbi:hypothetical protein FB451DRAFT_1182559 [Mycena latifolia]|nr:hypothetical protein FB451DRAFT_1182559 [Mycena latifolia]
MTDFISGHGESSSLNPIQRGPKACTNCRRRKIKCDSGKPICSQCRLRPPRSRDPCEYPRPEGLIPHESPTQMLETIQALRARIEELEYVTPPDPSRGYSGQPYTSPAQGQDILELFNKEPPPDLIVNLVDNFLRRFVDSGYFFIDPLRFRASALLPLPFGHRDRPSPSLLSAVYLWGGALSHITPPGPYTPDAFLLCALENGPRDLTAIGANPQMVLETIQTEVLLSFYYLHTALPVEGRYHASVAASLALGADLHLIRSPQQNAPYPPFVLASPVLPRPENAADEAVRINAFWTVVLINNHWVGADGSPSAIPYGMPIDTPWPGSSQGGATITRFLNGSDVDGSSSVALLVKASILLERIIAFSARAVGPPDPGALASLDRRLHTFQAALPPLPGTQLLVLTHALVDLAIVRLHAPYARPADPGAGRAKLLAAAARAVAGLGAGTTDILASAHSTDPMLGPVYATMARVYMADLAALARHPRQAQELEGLLGSLMSAMASLAAYSPIIDRCFVDARTTYAGMTGAG